MKINILNCFNAEGHTDHETLFLWFAGKMMDRYGYEVAYTMNTKDFKVLVKGNTAGDYNVKMVKGLHYAFDFQTLSENTTSWRLSAKLVDKLNHKAGRRTFGKQKAEITDPQVIGIWVYLRGYLSGSEEWANDGIKICDWNEQPDVLDKGDLAQLLSLKKGKWHLDLED